MASASRSIGLYLPVSETHTHRVFNGVLGYAEEHPGIVVRDFCYANRRDSEENSPQPGAVPPWTGQVDAVVTSVSRSVKAIEWVQRGGVPAINASAETVGTSLASVSVDVESHVRIAVDHLAELGLRNFACLGHGEYYGTQLRRDALSRELARRKLTLHVVQLEGPPSDPSEYFGSLARENGPLESLLQAAARPMAIVTTGPELAVGACLIASRMGLRIPDDVAVLSLHDTDILRVSTPPVTGIRTPGEQIGYEAARLLHRMLDGKRLARRDVQVPIRELIVRESTAGWQRNVRTNIDRAVKLVEARACEGIRVEDLADELCMSRRTFELQFAAAIGHTVGEEIRRVRLERAKELLSGTELSFTRIAVLTGFGNSSYFARFFRQHTGLTPSEFRARAGCPRT